MTLRAWIVVTLAALVAACAARPLRPELPPEQVAAAEAQQLARERRLRLQSDWSLVGRIAVSNDGNGGSGRLEWRQTGTRFEVALSAPVTRQSWRLTGDAGEARLEGLDGGPRRGPDARRLLLEATGWDIPVTALADWVRGARAAGPGPVAITYGAGGRPTLIEQGGWRIAYEWPDDASAPLEETDALPTRLDARRGEARVRLIIDQWVRDGADA